MPSNAPLQDAQYQDQQDRSNQDQETQQNGIQGNHVSAELLQAAAVGPRPPPPAETIIFEVPLNVVDLNAIFDVIETNPLFRSARGLENVEPQVILPDIPESQEPIASEEATIELIISPEELARARPRRLPISRVRQIINFTTSAARRRFTPEEIDNDPRVAEFFRLPVETQSRVISQSIFLLDDILPRTPLTTRPRPQRAIRLEREL